MTQTEMERSLPEGQQKMEEERDEDQLPANIEDTDYLREQMEDIFIRTNPDGTLEGIVKDLHYTKEGGTIAVDIDLPAEPDLYREHFTKPKVWSRRYEFVRFVEEYGHRASTITSMLEDGVTVKVRETDEGYELVIPFRIRENIKKELGKMRRKKHPLWYLIPAAGGVSLTSIFFSFIMDGNLILDLLASAAIGLISGLVIGFFVLVFGIAFLGWEPEN